MSGVDISELMALSRNIGALQQGHADLSKRVDRVEGMIAEFERRQRDLTLQTAADLERRWHAAFDDLRKDMDNIASRAAAIAYADTMKQRAQNADSALSRATAWARANPTPSLLMGGLALLAGWLGFSDLAQALTAVLR
jgi:predicted  nucleic acid-binding Zn-ribbon protein